MKKAFKIAAIVFVIVLLLLLIPIGILISIDLNEYKGLISDSIKKQTGRELVLSGSIDKTFFPWLGVNVGAMQLSNAPGFGEAPFAKLDKVEVRVKLLPLIKKQIVVDKIVLHGLHLQLARNAAGVSNWEDLVAKPSATQDAPLATESDIESKPSTPSKPSAAPDEKQPILLDALTVGGLDIRDARIVWDDQTMMQHYELNKVNLQTGEVILNQPVNVQLALAFAAKQPQLSGEMTFSAEITAALQQQLYSIQESRVTIKANGEALPLKELLLNMSANIDADLSKQTATISALQVNAMGVDVDAEVSARRLLEKPAVQTSLTIKVGDHQALANALQPLLPAQLNHELFKDARLAFTANVSLDKQTARIKPIKANLAGLNLNGVLSVQRLLDKPSVQTELTLNVDDQQKLNQGLQGLLPPEFNADLLKNANLAVKANASLQTQAAQINPLELNIAGLKLHTEIAAKSFIENPTFQGSLRLQPFNPRQTLLSAGVELPPMADSKVMRNVSLSSKFQGNTDEVSLKALDLKFDDTRINGSLAVSQFAQPKIRYDLTVNQLDVDRYLPPAEQTPAKKPTDNPSTSNEKTAPESSAKNEDPELPIPVELLRTLNIDGKLRVAKLTAKNLKTSQIMVGVNAKQGLLKIPVQAKLYKGSSKGELQLDVRQETPRFVIQEDLKGVDFGPLLQDLLQEDYVSGVANINATLSTRGYKVSELKQNLNGKTRFDFRRGRIKYLDIADILLTDYAKYLRMALENRQPEITTVFKELNGTMNVKNAVVHNDDLYLRSSRFDVKGKGRVDLVKETIGYTAYTEIINPTGGMKKVGLHKLQGIPIPIHFRGTFSQPEYNVDWEKPIKEAAKRQIKKEQEKLKQKAQEQLDKEKKKLEEKAKKEAQEEVDKLEEKLKEKFRKIF